MAIWLGVLFVEPDVLKSQSLGSRLHAIVITAIVVVAFDVWFSRRMGLTIDERGITLHYAFHRRRVPWANVQGFEWKRWNSPRSEWIWITCSSGRPIRIPTVQRTPGGGKRSFVYGFLSGDLRLKGGGQADAMATLEVLGLTAGGASSVDGLNESTEPSDRPVLAEDGSTDARRVTRRGAFYAAERLASRLRMRPLMNRLTVAFNQQRAVALAA